MEIFYSRIFTSYRQVYLFQALIRKELPLGNHAVITFIFSMPATLSVTQTIQRQLIGSMMSSKLERIWKEAVLTW
jgi:hypothetical protein